MSRFCREYKALVGSMFPYRRNGFSSAEEMLHHMSNVVQFGEGKDGSCYLYGVADESSFMPSWVSKKARKCGNDCYHERRIGTQSERSQLMNA